VVKLAISSLSKSAGVLALLLGVWANAAAEDVDPRHWAFAIDVDRTGEGLGVGSVTYLGSKERDAYFATCYHVLQGATKFHLPQLAAIDPASADSQVLVKRAHDLVFNQNPLE
jgi:hypothetical protein